MKNELERMKRVLIIIDMVKGFRVEGNMAIKDIPHIDEEIKKLVERFLNNGDDVISVMEGHTNDSVEFNDFPEHCILGTSEAELIDILKPYQDRMICIRKNSTSGFNTEGLQKYLKENAGRLKEIVFAGVCMDICVMNTVLPTKMYLNQNNIKCDVIVPLNATETFDAPGHSREEYKDIATKVLKLNGIKVPNRY